MSVETEESSGAPSGLLVGARLRALRQKRGLTLQEVADETGFALSVISLMERDKVSITVDHLSRLARFYGIRMVSLLEGEPDERLVVFRSAELAGDRELAAERGSAAFRLLSGGRSSRQEPLQITINPGGGDPDFRSHSGESFVIVLDGSVEVIAETGERVALGPGDAASFHGFPARRIVNGSGLESARLIIVTSPPTDRRDDVVDRRAGVIMQSEED